MDNIEKDKEEVLVTDRKEESLIEWLEKRSMLHRASLLPSRRSSPSATKPYSRPDVDSLLHLSDVWFTAYPSATITGDGESILSTLASDDLWTAFESIGINGIHTGPLKRSGGVDISKRSFTNTCDGWFDRICYDVDECFGSKEDFDRLVTTCRTHSSIVLGDIVPGHSGLGPDWILATMNYKDYPAIYSMVEVPKEEWSHLPHVHKGDVSANLSFEQTEYFTKMGCIAGDTQRPLFSVPGEPEKSSYDVTDIITGVDGVQRRWIYLHLFKPAQPTYNWISSSLGAAKIVLGDISTSLRDGSKVLRLDANPFLGIENRGHKTYSECAPISSHWSNFLTWSIRNEGCWSFQELDHALDFIKEFSLQGADLSYDFALRPSYQHALLTGDASLLNCMMKELQLYKIDQRGQMSTLLGLIHAMQSHDEITYEMTHLIAHSDDIFSFGEKEMTGRQIHKQILREMYERVTGHEAHFAGLTGNGVSTTYTGWVCIALGIEDPWSLSDVDLELVVKGHLLMAFFNIMQPGVFAISGWDLVGSLPLHRHQVESMTDVDGDWRWLNRGSYNLISLNHKESESKMGIASAKALYGSVSEQLKSPNSFASELKSMLKMRKELNIAHGYLVGIVETGHRSITATIYRVPSATSTSNVQSFSKFLILINWSIKRVCVDISLDLILGESRVLRRVSELNEWAEIDLEGSTNLRLQLEGWEGEIYEIVS